MRPWICRWLALPKRWRRAVRAHDSWFRAEVEQALREADDPDVRRIPHKEVAANWRRRRADLAKTRK